MMKNDWLKIIGSAALALSLFGGTAVQAEEGGFADWDADTSGDLTYEEWDAGFDDEGLFDDWDADDDNLLSEDEYGEGIYDVYDTDDDGLWDEEEFELYEDDAGDEGFWDV